MKRCPENNSPEQHAKDEYRALIESRLKKAKALAAESKLISLECETLADPVKINSSL